MDHPRNGGPSASIGRLRRTMQVSCIPLACDFNSYGELLEEALQRLEAKQTKQDAGTLNGGEEELDACNKKKQVNYMSPIIHSLQCEYLLSKLERALREALEALQHKGPSSKRFGNFLQLLFVLAEECFNFIDGCCEEDWLQAAIMSTSVSEHVSLVGSNLEVLAYFLESGSTTWTTKESMLLDSIYNDEVEVVKKRAREDKEKLKKKVKEFVRKVQMEESTNGEEFAMALFLQKKLEGLTLEKDVEGYFKLSSKVGIGTVRMKEVEELGRGVFGTVKKATWLNGVAVAMKSVQGRFTQVIMNEVSILAGLSHPNIISLLCWIHDNEECSIVMELMDEDLHSLMKRQKISIFEGVDLMLQIALGMCYLHEKRIVHNDLKSYNILVRCIKAKVGGFSRYLQVKVADFELASRVDGGSEIVPMKVITLELRDGWLQTVRVVEQKVSVKVDYCKLDIYSFGMVCYEILTGKVPFATSLFPKEVEEKILAGKKPRLPLLGSRYEGLTSLIKACWDKDPNKRPSFDEISKTLRDLKWLLLIVP